MQRNTFFCVNHVHEVDDLVLVVGIMYGKFLSSKFDGFNSLWILMNAIYLVFGRNSFSIKFP